MKRFLLALSIAFIGLTLVTPDAIVGKELMRTTVDSRIRGALKRLGVQFMLESVVSQWHGDRHHQPGG